MAESKGFEPLVALTTQPFQDCTLNRSDNSPVLKYNTKEYSICQTKKSRVIHPAGELDSPRKLTMQKR